MVALGRLVPAKIAMVRVMGAVTHVTGHDLYVDGVVDHAYRNGLIAVAANWLVHLGKRVLVLTKEIRHAEALAAAITGAVQVDGRDNSVLSGRLAQLHAGTIRCIVGTSVIGEGVDVPAADALVYAAGGRSPVKHKQDYFRVLTGGLTGKDHGIIVDFADIHHPQLEMASANRLGHYRAEAAFTSEVIDPSDLPTWLQRAG
jgi:superfamily II DNA or RNA helicase